MPRVLKLALVLCIEQFSARVEDGQSGNPLVERNTVLLRDVHVLVEPPYVNVDDDKIFLDARRQLRLLHGFFEDVTIETPVPAKIEDNILMFFPRAHHRRANIRPGVRAFVVERFLLGQGASCDDQKGRHEHEPARARFPHLAMVS